MNLPRPRRLFDLFVRAAKAWSDDYAPSMGAAISYYTVFSLAPLLVIVIAVAGAVFGRDAVTGQIVGELRGLVGQQGATVVQNLVIASSDTHKGLIAGVIGAVVLVLGATSVFTELQTSLDRIWHVPAAQKPSGVRAILRARLLSFGVIVALVFLLMVSLTVSAALAAIGGWAVGVAPGMKALLEVLNFVLSLGVATLLFAIIYKVLPSTRIAWRDVWIGAFATAVLFEIGKSLIGLYLGHSSMTQTFAAAGSLVVLIAWVYYAAQIFLLGAEFTKLFAQEHGSLRGVQPAAAAAAPVGGKPESASHLTPAHGHGHGLSHLHMPGLGHHGHEPSAALARLEETRQRLETEVPPRFAELKQNAKKGAAATAGAMLGTLALAFASRKAARKRDRVKEAVRSVPQRLRLALRRAH